MCHSVDYDVFANRSPQQLLAHRNETAHLLLVCNRWRRVVTPLKYETVIVTSQAEASILASILSRGQVGSYVKKLRIEGGFGQALHKVLSQVPRLVYLFVSLDITSESKGAGLCAGLKLVNPRYLILRDRRILGNKGVHSVVDTLITCMKTSWTNLVSSVLPERDSIPTLSIRYHMITRTTNSSGLVKSTAVTDIEHERNVQGPSQGLSSMCRSYRSYTFRELITSERTTWF
jgi:hypothetical protein